jgi:hypothetical protein
MTGQHLARRERVRHAGRLRRPPVARRESWIEDHLVHEHALQVHGGTHLVEEVRRQGDVAA